MRWEIILLGEMKNYKKSPKKMNKTLTTPPNDRVKTKKRARADVNIDRKNLYHLQYRYTLLYRVIYQAC